MAFCTHCGAKLPDGAKFCTTCGTPIAAPTANPTPLETQTRVPDTKGEVELAGWEEFVPDGQAPKHQAPPSYQAPTYQAGPAGYRPAAPAAPAQRTAPAQPKKRVAIGRIIIGVIVTAAVLAMIFNL